MSDASTKRSFISSDNPGQANVHYAEFVYSSELTIINDLKHIIIARDIFGLISGCPTGVANLKA